MDESQLTENFYTGLFEDIDGRRFIRCDFLADTFCWIDVTEECWSCIYAGQVHEIDWRALGLPDSTLLALQNVVQSRMRKLAPSYLSRVNNTMENLMAASFDVELGDRLELVSASDWQKIWKRMVPDCRVIFRSLLMDLALLPGFESMYDLTKEMEGWKAREDVTQMRCVLEWDAEKGSLSSSESEILRATLKRQGREQSNQTYESDEDMGFRLYGWILFETIKRPIQILAVRRSALNVYEGAPGLPAEYALKIPRAKAQASGEAESWQITEQLGREITAYSCRTKISALQQQYDRLLVFPRWEADLKVRGQHSGTNVSSGYKQWMRKQNAVSPRTKRPLKANPRRIRHTGATGMAMQGVPLEDIQHNLEHDSPASAQAYIDSVGEDLLPMFENSDRGLGTIFGDLNDAFFKGRVVSRINRRPIAIPVVSERPAIVGSCGKTDACTKHPFWACYDGCPLFLAWREADHAKSLAFLQAEKDRLSLAEDGKERTKLGKDFDRVAAAVKDVIARIESSNQPESG
jgi:hypothetical protein